MDRSVEWWGTRKRTEERGQSGGGKGTGQKKILVWLRFYHIDLFQPTLLYILLLTALVIIFFFMAGLIIGTLQKKMTRAMALGVFYVVSFVILPLALDLHTRVKTADMESQFNLELKNLVLIMNVEKRLYEKFGQSRDWEIASPQLMEKILEALNREFRVLFEREDAFRDHLQAKIRARHYISSWYPAGKGARQEIPPGYSLRNPRKCCDNKEDTGRNPFQRMPF